MDYNKKYKIDCKICGKELKDVGHARKYCDKCNRDIKLRKSNEWNKRDNIKQKELKGLVCRICGCSLTNQAHQRIICKSKKCFEKMMIMWRKEYYQKNKEKMKRASYLWQKKNVEKHRAHSLKYWRKKHPKK